MLPTKLCAQTAVIYIWKLNLVYTGLFKMPDTYVCDVVRLKEELK